MHIFRPRGKIRVMAEKSKGILSRLWKAHSTVASVIGLFGLPVYGFLSKAAVEAQALDPHVGVVGILTHLWGMMAGTASEFLAPGSSIIVGQLTNMFNFASGAFAAPAALPALTP